MILAVTAIFAQTTEIWLRRQVTLAQKAVILAQKAINNFSIGNSNFCSKDRDLAQKTEILAL